MRRKSLQNFDEWDEPLTVTTALIIAFISGVITGILWVFKWLGVLG